MPLNYRIISDRGLVVCNHSGFFTIDDFIELSAAYVADNDYAPGQKQLVNMSDITGFEKNYVRFMNIQAAKAERLAGLGVQSIAVYIAPTPVSHELASLFTRSWAGVDAVVTMIQHNEADALELLGQRETSINELIEAPTAKVGKLVTTNNH